MRVCGSVQVLVEAIIELDLLQVDGQVFEVGGFHEQVRIVPLKLAG